MAHAPLRTLVDERIFPDDAIQNLGLPSIIYQRVSGYRVNSLSGYSRLENPRFQFNIYSRLVDDLRTIFDAMLAALEAATTFTAVPDDSPWDDYDPVVDIYRRVVTIGFWNDERV